MPTVQYNLLDPSPMVLVVPTPGCQKTTDTHDCTKRSQRWLLLQEKIPCQLTILTTFDFEQVVLAVWERIPVRQSLTIFP